MLALITSMLRNPPKISISVRLISGICKMLITIRLLLVLEWRTLE